MEGAIDWPAVNGLRRPRVEEVDIGAPHQAVCRTSAATAPAASLAAAITILAACHFSVTPTGTIGHVYCCPGGFIIQACRASQPRVVRRTNFICYHRFRFSQASASFPQFSPHPSPFGLETARRMPVICMRTDDAALTGSSILVRIPHAEIAGANLRNH